MNVPNDEAACLGSPKIMSPLPKANEGEGHPVFCQCMIRSPLAMSASTAAKRIGVVQEPQAALLRMDMVLSRALSDHPIDGLGREGVSKHSFQVRIHQDCHTVLHAIAPEIAASLVLSGQTAGDHSIAGKDRY